MKLFNSFAIVVMILCNTTQAQIKAAIVRKEFPRVNIGSRTISTVDMQEIKLAEGQKTGYHKHPCPVVGYIISGTVLFQVEGEEAKVLKSGDDFYEPADTPIVHFDNNSSTEPLKFIACYLLNGEKEHK